MAEFTHRVREAGTLPVRQSEIGQAASCRCMPRECRKFGGPCDV